MSKRPFGLDIGATTLKAVWLSPKGDGFNLDASIIAPAPSKGMMSESPLDEEEMAQCIAKTAADAGISTTNVNVSLAENQVYTKVVEMPVLSDKELSSAIYWEAEQHIPVPLNSITLAWDVLNRPKEVVTNEKMQVLIVGAPTMLINKYQRILSIAGLNINAMETEIISTVRSLVVDDNLPPTLVVNVGSISTSFAIVKQGIIVFTYSMSIGGTAINRAIATDLGLSPTQAEEYKKTYGIIDENLGSKIGKATEPVLKSILSEIKKSIVFYADKYQGEEPVRQIILSGGTAKLPGIDLFFANNSGIETVIANPWKVLVSQQVPKDILDNAPDYAIAVGLAMRDYE